MAIVSPSLSFPDPTDAAAMAELRGIADHAAHVDGYHPFNEQTLLDLAAGRRRPVLIRSATGIPVGSAVIGAGELDLVVLPAERRHGYATAAVDALLQDETERLTAWAHGDHPGARALATRFGFEPVRTLLQLRMPLDGVNDSVDGSDIVGGPGSPVITEFRPGIDDADWLELNALAFASHPEQGSLTQNDLDDRLAEPWFDAGDFLLAREQPDAETGAEGRLIGFIWLKIEEADASGDERVGEVYVLGVHPDTAGRGLGRTLMRAGLGRLRARGCSTVALYVDADNTPAVRLYRSLGFTDHTIDVQYARA